MESHMLYSRKQDKNIQLACTRNRIENRRLSQTLSVYERNKNLVSNELQKIRQARACMRDDLALLTGKTGAITSQEKVTSQRKRLSIGCSPLLASEVQRPATVSGIPSKDVTKDENEDQITCPERKPSIGCYSDSRRALKVSGLHSIEPEDMNKPKESQKQSFVGIDDRPCTVSGDAISACDLQIRCPRVPRSCRMNDDTTLSSLEDLSKQTNKKLTLNEEKFEENDSLPMLKNENFTSKVQNVRKRRNSLPMLSSNSVFLPDIDNGGEHGNKSHSEERLDTTKIGHEDIESPHERENALSISNEDFESGRRGKITKLNTRARRASIACLPSQTRQIQTPGRFVKGNLDFKSSSEEKLSTGNTIPEDFESGRQGEKTRPNTRARRASIACLPSQTRQIQTPGRFVKGNQDFLQEERLKGQFRRVGQGVLAAALLSKRRFSLSS